jgi:hypothetical protein
MKMNQKGMIFNPVFWSLVEAIIAPGDKVSVGYITEKYGVTQELVERLVQFLQSNGSQISIDNDQLESEAHWIKSELKQPEYHFKLNQRDMIKLWCTVYYVYNLDNGLINKQDLGQYEDNGFFSSMDSKVFEQFKDLIQLLNNQETKKVKLSESPKNNSLEKDQEMSELINLLEESINSQEVISLELLDDKYMSLFPHRLVMIENDLSLIGEDLFDKTLALISLAQIKSLENTREKAQAIFSIMDIENFLTGIRVISGNEIRLVFKVLNQDFEFAPDEGFYFFRNPCMITNQKGEYIWAAYVEPGEALFQWLESLKTPIEILDPEGLKEEFNQYLEKQSKIKKIA